MSLLGILKEESAMCPVNQHCLQWAKRYIGTCLCSTRHGLSVGLGVMSVVSWCVAEIPQIITNYRKKSAEGLSILFLMTWIVGDSFNLFGCMLEPETLPTQYYTAVLYAVTTVILTLQAIYYDHIYPRLKSKKRRQEVVQAEAAERRERSNDSDSEKASYVTPSSTVHDASSVPSSYEELYFMSARSLSVSRTPPAGNFLGPRSPVLDLEQRWFKEPLLGEGRSPKSASPKMKTMLCVVSLMTFLVGSHNHLRAERFESNSGPRNPTGGIVFQVGRQLLEATRSSTLENVADAGYSSIGSILGWGMAAIYLGGRLPQIYLNIKRGHTEGLNPLMFVFAVIGNTTYVASILVNSLHWLKIKPNLPWLVDAGGCVILDAFILIQFVYFRYRPRTEVEKNIFESPDMNTRGGPAL